MLKFQKIEYENIWPFANQTKIINFEHWKFLIKAPIGSWKSFLYFDGPTYALYKWSKRKILNVNCKTWKIILDFEIEWDNYRIERYLKQWKTKESCKSRLYKDWEEIQFKNDKDLQATLEQLLPPREVFLATYLLMQDSPNIFELAPQERLEIFKHIFNLLWIDEKKEIIWDAKRQLSTKLKVLEDTEKYDIKLNDLLFNLIDNLKKIEFDNLNLKKRLDEIEPFVWKIKSSDFDFDLIGNEFDDFEEEINLFKKSLIEDKSKLNNLEQMILDLEKKQKSLNDNIYKLQVDLKKLEQENSSFDKNKLDQAKDQKKSFLKKLDDISVFSKKKSLEFLGKEMWIVDFYDFIKDKIKEWESLSDKNRNLDLQITINENKIKELNTNLNTEKNNLKDKIKLLQTRLKDVELSLEDLHKDKINLENFVEEQMKFKCSKIKDYCPFVKEINKKSFEQFQKQKEVLIQRENKIKQEKLELINQIEELENKLKILSDEFYLKKDLEIINQEIEFFKKQKNQIETKMSDLRKLLKNIWRKEVESKYKEYNDIHRKISDLDKFIVEQESLYNKLQDNKQKMSEIAWKIQEIQKQLWQLEEERQKLQELKKDLEEQIYKKELKNSKLLNQENYIEKYKNIVVQIKNLVSDIKENNLEIKKIKEKLIIVSNLYNLFSKELLLIVLQESIPILNDIINSYLAEVVDYQIKMKILQENEKIFLDIIIADQHWEREVKSLSWGQKVVLKIAWMLAVASFMKTSMLFLDETINNLDPDAISGVAQMLEDFVKQQQIDLYIVTHSTLIQEMNIWDKVIQI